MASYYSKVIAHINESFGITTPTQETIAFRMGLSTRTLQRRLAQEGLRFADVLSEARHHKAIELLKDTDKSLENISSILGYMHVTGFYKSFKNKTGKSPNEVRIELLES